MRRSTYSTPSARVLAALVLTTALLVPGVAQGAPTNAAIRSKQRQAARANDRLAALSATLEMRGEELGQLEDELTGTREKEMAAERQLEVATQQLDQAQSQLDYRATSIYRNGQLNVVSVFIGVNSFQDFLNRVDLMRRIGASDAGVVTDVKVARDRVERTRADLLTRQDELTSLRDQAREKQREVQQALDEQQSYLASLKRDIKKLISAERARQERLAKLAARRNGVSFDPSALHGPHADVARIALRYLGVKYVWGGTTPAGFDCSGLAQYCYAQVGIHIPRTSREQFHAGAYIPPDRKDLLAAGDLVFFGYHRSAKLIHHVGIYLGGGDFINAPQTGDVVRIAALSSRDDYVGACRP